MSKRLKHPLHLAFLGCGAVTRKHSKTLRRYRPQLMLYYASRSEARAQQYCRQHRGQGWFASYQQALEDERIDAVLVATPPDQHLELTLRALEAGKHVIVEKPPFLKSSDFDRVQQAMARSNRQVMVAENYFYKPLLGCLARWLEEGRIGDPMFFLFNALKRQQTGDWRDDPATAGGGALFEGGIHWINFVSNLGFTIQNVQGYLPGQKSLPEKSMLVAFAYQEGPVGTLFYSWEIPSLFQGLRISRIFGRRGSITFESNGVFALVHGYRSALVFPGFRDISGYQAMFEDFLQAIAENRQPRFNLTLARRDVALIEQIYTSLRNQTQNKE
ncbi:MAG: gfo/Idh/MocA family oxidoreductase [Calditrichaeota bacterium]|nr:MAG: gfo/Idh/MocA family oxidoreductase [Calditrichota bacterium]